MVSNWKDAVSIYDFEVENLDGEMVSLSEFKGKVLLIVNSATKCVLAKQNFKELSELYERYRDKGFEILCFPCNQFGMEMKSNEEMKEFVKEQAIKWHMFAKCHVNGDHSIPMYKWLKHKTESSSFMPKMLKWNFTKFLVDKSGQPVVRYSVSASPLSFEADIERELKK